MSTVTLDFLAASQLIHAAEEQLAAYDRQLRAGTLTIADLAFPIAATHRGLVALRVAFGLDLPPARLEAVLDAEFAATQLEIAELREADMLAGLPDVPLAVGIGA